MDWTNSGHVMIKHVNDHALPLAWTEPRLKLETKDYIIDSNNLANIGSSVCCAMRRGAALSRTSVSCPELQENVARTDEEAAWALAWSSPTSAPATGLLIHERPRCTYAPGASETLPSSAQRETDERCSGEWRPLDALHPVGVHGGCCVAAAALLDKGNSARRRH
jgi:hypothetical protein